MSSTYLGKRALDVSLVLLSSILWVPLLIATAIVVRIRLGSPIVFRQRRVGQHGRLFELIKFRTMTDERDASGQLLPDNRRMTPFGAWLRVTSLDELPELINVLRGDMSLVGPRPLLEEYLPLYSAKHARRHDVPPGLTGLAQVSGRNALSWSDRFDLDVRYAQEASLKLDLSILAQTVRAVTGREGINSPGEVTMARFTGYQPSLQPRDLPATPGSRSPDRVR